LQADTAARAYHRDQDSLGAHVERLLDQHMIVPGHARHRHRGRAIEGRQACLKAFIGKAAMFGVDKDPIKARACHDLGDHGIGDRDPASESGFAPSQPAFQL
jgi:hypothetical protein